MLTVLLLICITANVKIVPMAFDMKVPDKRENLLKITISQRNIIRRGPTFFHCRLIGSTPQSIQSARLSLQPSELGPPLTRKRVLVPPLGPRVETHSPAGWGEPIPTKGQTLWYSLGIL